MWTRTCETTEYVDFLSTLHDRIAISVNGELYYWREDASVHFDPKFDAEGLESPERVTPAPTCLSATNHQIR